jgi:Tfp pilus assembly protein PilN
MTIKVDLLDKPGRRSGFDPVVFFMIILIIFSIGGFYFYGSSLDKQIAQIRSDIAVKDEEITKLEEKIPQIAQLEEINRDLENQINVIKELVYDPLRYANLLDEIAFIMPENIFIKNLSIQPNNRSMTFSGDSIASEDAQPLDSISKFMQNIQNSRYFSDATLSNTQRTQASNQETAFSFQIQAVYDPVAAAKD